MPTRGFFAVPTFLEAEKYIPGIQNMCRQILQKKIFVGILMSHYLWHKRLQKPGDHFFPELFTNKFV